MKKDTGEIPTLGEDIKKLDAEVPKEEEPKKEALPEETKQEEKLQVITNEQLIHLKLDDLSLQVQQIDPRIQELTSLIQKLIDVLRRKK